MDNSKALSDNLSESSSDEAQFTKINVKLQMVLNYVDNEEDKNCICSYQQASDSDNLESEIIPDLLVPHNRDDDIKLFSVLIELKKLGYPLNEAMIQVYSYEFKQYILFGNDISKSIILKENEYILNGVLKLKCTCYLDESYLSIPDYSINDIVTEHEQHNNSQSEIESKSVSVKQPKKSKKSKEARVGHIIEKVNLWRKLFNGYHNHVNKYIKLSLKDAAKEIDTSKKTLDDFLRQLRLGRKYGYDFNTNIKEKVGELRSFVKNKLNK